MKFAAGLLAFSLVATAFSAPSAKPKPQHAKAKHAGAASPAKSAHRAASTPSVKALRTQPAGAGRTRGRGRGRARKPSGPSYQAHPDPERYQQIQQILTEKGYYRGEVNGQWGDDSADALKRFQADRQLDSDGKITALTLRDLGLGPKHDGSSAPLSGTLSSAAGSAKGFPPNEPAAEPPPMPTEPPEAAVPPE